jgi:hypothetical protein
LTSVTTSATLGCSDGGSPGTAVSDAAVLLTSGLAGMLADVCADPSAPPPPQADRNAPEIDARTRVYVEFSKNFISISSGYADWLKATPEGYATEIDDDRKFVKNCSKCSPKQRKIAVRSWKLELLEVKMTAFY